MLLVRATANSISNAEICLSSDLLIHKNNKIITTEKTRELKSENLLKKREINLTEQLGEFL